jgi:hypothetical protein
MLEKQAGLNQAQTTNPLLMQQQMLTEALTSGLPAPHLAHTPNHNSLPTSAPPAGSADVNVSELLAAAAAAAAAAADSAPMAGAGNEFAALQAGGLLPPASAASMRPGALGHMMNQAASAGMPHMPPPGALSSLHQRMGSGMHGYPHKAGMHGGNGMGGGHGGIGAGRQHGNAQAAAAAAAIAAVAAQAAGPYGPDGPATDSQGNILPLSRLQEIWSR